MIRRPPRSTLDRSSAASDVYKRQDPLLALLVRRDARDDDALRVDHLPHDAAAAVRRGREDRVDAELLGADHLQTAEEDVRGGVASRQRDAEPAEERLTMPERRRLVPVAESQLKVCLLYTSDAADERSSVDLGGRRIIKKKNTDVRISRSHIN